MATKTAVQVENMEMPQVMEGTNDPDNYMMLTTTKNKRPSKLHITCIVLSIIFAFIAVCIDQISHGQIEFSSDVDDIAHDKIISHITYNCGWNAFQLTYPIGNDITDTYTYNGNFCKQNDETFDHSFCEHSIRDGIIWFIGGIIGIILLCISIPVLFKFWIFQKYGGKDSWLFAILTGISLSCFGIGSFNWLLNNKCQDVAYDSKNHIVSEFLEADIDTIPGVSLYLMWTALFCVLVAVLISTLHINNKINRINRQYFMNQNNIQ
eukprot:547802_1